MNVNEVIAPVRRTRWQRIRGWLLLLIFLAAVGAGGYYALNNPDRVYVKTEEVDISSGRMRNTTTLFGRRIGQTVLETAISQTIGSSAAPANWQIVSVTSPLPLKDIDTPYGDAFAQINTLENLWSLTPFSDDARREVALNLIKLWNLKDDAHDYVQTINGMAWKNPDKPIQKITASDLPNVANFEHPAPAQ